MLSSEASVGVDLPAIIGALQRDYTKLAPRIRTLSHSVSCECGKVSLHLHYPAFRQGKATVPELVDMLVLFLTPFALPRAQIAVVMDQYTKINADEFALKTHQLFQSAVGLFKRANEVTNRNGEAGELILYLLTEWILGAPQLIAKMALKTNPQMPVHGADGVHVRYCSETSRLKLYWGESKLYADIEEAIAAAIKSITEALNPQKMKHELQLVERNIDFAGLSQDAKTALLQYLNPFDEAYNKRHDVITCLVGFNFEAFQQLTDLDEEAAEGKFCQLARDQLNAMSEKMGARLKQAGLAGQPIEMFFLPLPSVQQLRDLFQTKIGWKS